MMQFFARDTAMAELAPYSSATSLVIFLIMRTVSWQRAGRCTAELCPAKLHGFAVDLPLLVAERHLVILHADDCIAGNLLTGARQQGKVADNLVGYAVISAFHLVGVGGFVGQQQQAYVFVVLIGELTDEEVHGLRFVSLGNLVVEQSSRPSGKLRVKSLPPLTYLSRLCLKTLYSRNSPSFFAESSTIFVRCFL